MWPCKKKTEVAEAPKRETVGLRGAARILGVSEEEVLKLAEREHSWENSSFPLAVGQYRPKYSCYLIQLPEDPQWYADDLKMWRQALIDIHREEQDAKLATKLIKAVIKDANRIEL